MGVGGSIPVKCGKGYNVFAFLNRLRGTSSIYAKVFAIVFAIIYGSITGSIIVFGLMFAAFILGESFGWSKWFGSLAYPDLVTDEIKSDLEGYSNGIHWIANKLSPQNKDFLQYCYTALVIRGVYWWLPVYLVMCWAGIISWPIALSLTILLSILFPISVLLAREYEEIIPTVNLKWLSIDGVWEKAEVVYGIFIGLLGVAVPIVVYLVKL